MPYRLDCLHKSAHIDGRVLWHYEHPTDPVDSIMEERYFPKSLEIEEVVRGEHCVWLMMVPDAFRWFYPLLRPFGETIDRIADSVLDEDA